MIEHESLQPAYSGLASQDEIETDFGIEFKGPGWYFYNSSGENHAMLIQNQPIASNGTPIYLYSVWYFDVRPVLGWALSAPVHTTLRTATY